MPSERILLPLLGVALRPVLAQHDEIFLRRLYREVREPELALTPWSEAQRQAFSDSQFTLQDRHYRAHYPGTQFWVVERAGVPIGRLYVDESQEGPVCLMEISLLLTHRGQGLGEGLVRWVLDRADAAARPVRLYVEADNPARRLYERLGFIDEAQDGVYRRMGRPPMVTGG